MKYIKSIVIYFTIYIWKAIFSHGLWTGTIFNDVNAGILLWMDLLSLSFAFPPDQWLSSTNPAEATEDIPTHNEIIFFFFLTQIISIGWGKAKGLRVKARLERSHTPRICLAGRQDQAGIREASGRYAEGTKSNYSHSDFYFSKPLDYTCHHNGTGVAERNGQAHWDDIKVL